jgi:hypothetical protein
LTSCCGLSFLSGVRRNRTEFDYCRLFGSASAVVKPNPLSNKSAFRPVPPSDWSAKIGYRFTEFRGAGVQTQRRLRVSVAAAEMQEPESLPEPCRTDLSWLRVSESNIET